VVKVACAPIQMPVDLRTIGCAMLAVLMAVSGSLLIAAFVAGLAVIYRLEWSQAGALRQRRARQATGQCVMCGYDISTLSDENCPECGYWSPRLGPPLPHGARMHWRGGRGGRAGRDQRLSALGCAFGK
jgi:hypothetical protein